LEGRPETLKPPVAEAATGATVAGANIEEDFVRRSGLADPTALNYGHTATKKRKEDFHQTIFKKKSNKNANPRIPNLLTVTYR
jgi:hypothetical protein